MQWNDNEMEWKDWNIAYFNLFLRNAGSLIRFTPRMVWESVADSMPLTQEFTQKWFGPSQLFYKHILYQYFPIPKGVERGCWLNPKDGVQALLIIHVAPLGRSSYTIEQGGWYADQEGEHDFCGRERCVWSPNDSGLSWTSILNMIPQFWGS